MNNIYTRKAQGPDGVTPACLKTCAYQLAPIFTQIFNRSLEFVCLFVYLFGSQLAMLSSIASLPGVPTTLNIHTLSHTLKNTTIKNKLNIFSTVQNISISTSSTS